MQATTAAGSAGEGVGIARWTRLMPVAMLIYIISFMDRTNIGYAFDGLAHDFHIDKAQQGMAGGILLHRLCDPADPGRASRRAVERQEVHRHHDPGLGRLRDILGLATSFGQLLVARFFLGVAEGGIWPAMLVLISHWFPRSERARAYGFWMTNLAIASIITQPLSGFIVAHTTWRWLFIIEGALPFVVAAPIWWALVKDRPADAPWLSERERTWITSEIAKDRAGEPEHVPFSRVF